MTFLLPSPSSKSLLKLVIFYDISIRRIAPWNEYLELVPAVLQFSSLTLYKAANFLGRTPSASRSQTSLSQWVSVLVKQIQLDYLLLLLVKTVEMLNSPTKHQLLNWCLLYWKLSLTPFSSSKGCLPSLSPCRSRNILDDFREAYFWLRQNTDDNARYVHVWWFVNYNSPLRSLKGSLKVINHLIYHPLILDNFSCSRKTHLANAPCVRVNWVSCLLIRESFLTSHICTPPPPYQQPFVRSTKTSWR